MAVKITIAQILFYSSVRLDENWTEKNESTQKAQK